MNLPSRKERKALAKKLGLIKKKESFKEMTARFARAQEFGRMIHMQHLQNIQNELNAKNESSIEPNNESLNNQQELKKIIGGKSKEE